MKGGADGSSGIGIAGPGLVTLMIAAGLTFAAAPPAPLTLQVIAPATITDSAPRDITVRIANTDAAPLFVLPNMVHLRIEGQRAEYVPYPGPALDPWGGARELAPGATMKVEFRNASDRRGVWRLPPGNYRITAIYEVPQYLASPASIADSARVWRGQRASAPAMMTVK